MGFHSQAGRPRYMDGVGAPFEKLLEDDDSSALIVAGKPPFLETRCITTGFPQSPIFTATALRA
jgi:hypothetical protein